MEVKQERKSRTQTKKKKERKIVKRKNARERKRVPLNLSTNLQVHAQYFALKKDGIKNRQSSAKESYQKTGENENFLQNITF
jgi:hypothetical protein